MAEIKIKVGSVTNAQRAKKVFELSGYRALIRRSLTIKKGEGCGYSVVVKCDAPTARALLKKAGIRIISVEENDIS